MEDISSYCGNIESIADICSIYQQTNQQKYALINNTLSENKDQETEQDILMECLTNIALDFNAENRDVDSDELIVKFFFDL